MKIRVLYYSRSGNTRKLAEAVARGAEKVEGVTALLRSASEVTKEEFVGSAGIIAGSPVYFGTMAAELKAVFDKFVGVRRAIEGKIGAAFVTAGDDAGGKETTIISIIQAMLIYGMIVVGDPLDASGHYGVSSTGAPDKGTLENGAKLGRRVAMLAIRLATKKSANHER